MYRFPNCLVSAVGFTLCTLTVISSVSAWTIRNNLPRPRRDSPVQQITIIHSTNRGSRALHEITLNDPLNCLSRVVCGLSKFPPKSPTLRTSTTNDYAYLLRTVLSRISKYDHNKKDDELFDDIKEKIPEPEEDQDVEEATKEDDEDYSEEEDDEDKVGRKIRTQLRSTKFRQDRRYSERSGDPSIIGTLSEKMADDLEELVDYNKRNSNKQSVFEQLKPPVDLDKLELLRVSTDLGTKLSSSPAEQCTVLGNICPFRYDEMVKLITGILRRQTIVSPSGDKIIPLVGYILKSRNQTTTLTATFSAIERINNLTYTADEAGTPITFRHIYDEILNGMGTGSSGIRVLEDSNEKASSNVWEDDEFDQVLSNPYVEKKLANNYKIKNQQPVKPVVEEESSEEQDDPFQFVDFDSDTDDEESLENESGGKKTKFSDILSKKKNTPPPPPPPAFGTIRD